MAWLEPISATLGAAGLAQYALENSNFVKKFCTRFVYRCFNGELVVPVFGAGGVGKSTLGSVINGETELLGADRSYKESMVIEKFKLNGNVPGKLLVGPGQKRRSKETWQELFESIGTRNVRGFINVVGYGYHHTTEDALGLLVDKSVPNEEFMAMFTERARKAEIERLEFLIDNLREIEKPLWVLTLVTKQDLWWNRKREVREHYESGPYAAAMDRLTAKVNPHQVRHEIVPVSFIIENMYTRDRGAIAEVNKGYDQTTHEAYYAHMIHVLATLCGVE